MVVGNGLNLRATGDAETEATERPPNGYVASVVANTTGTGLSKALTGWLRSGDYRTMTLVLELDAALYHSFDGEYQRQ